MSEPGSVTYWIRQLQTGDGVASQRLWEGYYHRLVGLARKKLRGLPRGAADEEDVVLSAFDSFFRAAEAARFPRLRDRDDLWQILLLLTERKAIDLIQHEGREKRDWRRTRHETEPVPDGKQKNGPALFHLAAPEPDPAFAAQLLEECARLLDKLGDEELRLIAVSKMEGYTNEEIGAQRKCSLATVERRLRLIRQIWEDDTGA